MERDRIESQRFDVRRWERFRGLAGPYWRSDERWRAGVLLAALVLLLFGQTGFNVAFVELSGELTSALAARDGERFWTAIRYSVAVLLTAVPIWALYYYVRDTLGIHWRRWMTHRMLDAYLGSRAYYELNARGDIDNPDQRIAEDIATFTQQTLYFAMVMLGACIQLAAFTGLLWSISRELVYFLAGYALFGTLATALLFGRVLIGLNFRQLRPSCARSSGSTCSSTRSASSPSCCPARSSPTACSRASSRSAPRCRRAGPSPPSWPRSP